MNLVLGGGGLNGIAYISLLKILKKKNILNKINKFAGTSVGSLFIFLISIKANYNEIYNLFIYKIKYIFKIKYNNIKKGYIINKDIFEDILREILYIKLNKKYVTLLEYKKLTKCEMNIICTNLYKGKEKIFNINNTPNIDLIDSIIASCSVPILSKSIKIENEYYIDGSFNNAFPINIFENELNKTIAIGFYTSIYANKNMINIILNLLRNMIDINISKNTKKKCLYYIKLPSLLETFNINTSIKLKKKAYNIYYNIIEKKMNK